MVPDSSGKNKSLTCLSAGHCIDQIRIQSGSATSLEAECVAHFKHGLINAVLFLFFDWLGGRLIKAFNKAGNIKVNYSNMCRFRDKWRYPFSSVFSLLFTVYLHQTALMRSVLIRGSVSNNNQPTAKSLSARERGWATLPVGLKRSLKPIHYREWIGPSDRRTLEPDKTVHETPTASVAFKIFFIERQVSRWNVTKQTRKTIWTQLIVEFFIEERVRQWRSQETFSKIGNNQNLFAL